jgi:hypothetical protein
METWFQVDNLEVERLLSDWRWLCPSQMSLLARNVFGELFLLDEAGAVFWLNTTTGKMIKVSNSKVEFMKMAETKEKRREWFVENEMLAYAQRGLVPSSSQCIGFGIPAVFAEGGRPDTAYIADIYEHVSFLGDLHRQIGNLPDGSKVQLCVNPPKPASTK